MPDDLLERLAELEHEQWMHWSQYIAQNEDVPESLRSRWQENWRPYDDLEDDVQEKDRVWARKVLGVVQSALDHRDDVQVRLEGDQLKIQVRDHA